MTPDAYAWPTDRALTDRSDRERNSQGEHSMSTQTEWTDWLAAIGYGIDFSNDIPPPCTRRELAEAYQREAARDDRCDPEMTAEVWEWCIDENTGATFRESA